MKNRFIPYYLLLIFIISIPRTVQAKDDDDENNNQKRVSVSIEYDLTKRLSLSLTPELRYTNNWTLNKYLLELGGDYELTKWLDIEGTYYIAINKRKKKGDEFQYKYKIGPAFDKKFHQLKTGVKLYYSNYSDENENSDFFRCKYFIKYKIKKPKITPEIGAEYYHNLSENEKYKTRYFAELSYDIFKHNSIGLTYKLDDFYSNDSNKKIYELNYKIKF